MESVYCPPTRVRNVAGPRMINDNNNPRIQPEDLKNYFQAGYQNIGEFLDGQDWRDVECFEHDPANTIQGHRLAGPDRKELDRAKKALLLALFEAHGDEPVDYLEFGVMSGKTLSLAKRTLRHRDSRLFGFDTFTGLPEPWVSAWGNKKEARTARDRGDLSAPIMPRYLDGRVRLFKGLFQDTLLLAAGDIFERENRRGRTIINIDCDIYTGALFVLTTLHRYLKDGDVIYFDEFFDPLNEFAAFNDYVRSYHCRDCFTLKARAYDGFQFVYNAPKSKLSC